MKAIITIYKNINTGISNLLHNTLKMSALNETTPLLGAHNATYVNHDDKPLEITDFSKIEISEGLNQKMYNLKLNVDDSEISPEASTVYDSDLSESEYESEDISSDSDISESGAVPMYKNRDYHNVIYNDEVEPVEPKDVNLTVIKRSGDEEAIDFNKISNRLLWLNKHPYQLRVNPVHVALKVVKEIHPGIHTRELDEHAADIASNLLDHHPDFGVLATRIAVNNHHKNTLDCFSSTMEACYRNRAIEGGREVDTPRIKRDLYKFVQIHKHALNAMVDYDRDYRFSYFGFKTLMGSYLLKRWGPPEVESNRPQDLVLERPQDMWMRVSCAIHMNRLVLRDTGCLPYIKETYDALSMNLMTHATPTLTNAGTNGEQYLSCFLLGGEDSLESITKLLSDAATISKYSGGIGFWWNLRSSGSVVRGVNGISRGQIPYLKVAEAYALAVDQGGKRPGSFAHYLQPHHPDFVKWVELKRPTTGDIKHLFYGIWASDLFMRYCKQDKMWYFFNPNHCPELYGVYGTQFEEAYELAVAEKRYTTNPGPMPARLVMEEICKTQIQTGMPYLLFADAINRKNNMSNVYPTNSSNLCAEITIPSSSTEYACCTLGTLCLGAYVRERSDCDCMNGIHTRNCNITTWYDFDELRRVVRIMTRNLNKIIDINMYPVPETRRSNIKYRPLGIGIQGLADAFIRMGYKFTSTEAKTLNVQIAETIQWAALSESCELAKSQGPYESFWGSPASKGIMQHDMWGYTGPLLNDWDTLKRDIMEHGLRNALLVALPPTASTSQIQNQCECFEPFMSNFYARKTKAGTYTMLNDYLINVMIRYDLWTPEIREAFIKMKGEIQYDERDPRTHVFESIPQWIRDLGMTVWKLSNKELILMDRDRARWVCQTMSSNRFVKAPTVAKLSAMHMYCHELDLKTGMYYLRMIGASEATQFAGTIKAKSEKPRSPRKLKAEIIDDNGPSCTREGGCSG